MGQNKKITWLTDTPNWAFSNQANKIARLLDEYDHDIIHTSKVDKETQSKIDKADILVCMCPAFLVLVDDLGKTVLRLSGMRIL